MERMVRVLDTRPDLLKELLRLLGVPCEGFGYPCKKFAEVPTPSMTSYTEEPVEGELGANRDLFLCEECSRAYMEEMQSRWDEYHSGLL